jgi:cation transport regulator ChaB
MAPHTDHSDLSKHSWVESHDQTLGQSLAQQVYFQILNKSTEPKNQHPDRRQEPNSGSKLGTAATAWVAVSKNLF